jgi:hypothetical protein
MKVEDHAAAAPDDPPQPGERSALPPAPDGYDGTCLRPRGLCELGGCCDLCMHNPEPKDQG